MPQFEQWLNYIESLFDPVVHAGSPWLHDAEERESLLWELIEKGIRRNAMTSETADRISEHYNLGL